MICKQNFGWKWKKLCWTVDCRCCCRGGEVEGWDYKYLGCWYKIMLMFDLSIRMSDSWALPPNFVTSDQVGYRNYHLKLSTQKFYVAIIGQQLNISDSKDRRLMSFSTCVKPSPGHFHQYPLIPQGQKFSISFSCLLSIESSAKDKFLLLKISVTELLSRKCQLLSVWELWWVIEAHCRSAWQVSSSGWEPTAGQISQEPALSGPVEKGLRGSELMLKINDVRLTFTFLPSHILICLSVCLSVCLHPYPDRRLSSDLAPRSG